MKLISPLCLFPILAFLNITQLSAATLGDFRTKSGGNWNQPSIWQYYNGSTWVNATYSPTYTDDDVSVQAGHTVYLTASLTIDQLSVAGILYINSGITMTLSDGSSTDLSISNQVIVNGTLLCYGTISSVATELYFNNGSVYKHGKDGGSLPDATFNSGSTCEVTGLITSSSLSNSDQSFWHFKWNSPSQTSETNLAGNLTTIHGDFIMVSTGSGRLKLGETADYVLTIDGSWNQQGGTVNMGGGSSNGLVYLKGNFSMSGGKLTEYNSVSYYSKIFFSGGTTQTFTRSGGSFENNIDFEVISGTILDMGTSQIDGSLGGFQLNSGATLKSAHSGGVASSGASGCIQTAGRYFSSVANFHYYRSGAQSTGNGLPSPLSGKLTIGTTTNATNLTITNGNVTISNVLYLVSSSGANSSITTGTVSYGSNATLEYQGASAQTATLKEWPASSGPYHVVINNPNGVSLGIYMDRSINGNLTLTAGVFAIATNTLTLNGALSTTGGSLQGGSTSSLVVGGTAAAMNLPALTLYNLTISRSAGVNMTGSTEINGTLTLTSGLFTINGYLLTINGTPVSGNPLNLQASGTSVLKYGGSAEGHIIPSGVTTLGSLIIDNASVSGVTLSHDLHLTGTLEIMPDAGFSLEAGRLLTVDNSVIIYDY